VPLFPSYDTLSAPLRSSPSTLRPAAWQEALSRYPGSLGDTIHGILTYGALLGYEGPLALILSKNLSSAELDEETIEKQLEKDLLSGRVEITTPDYPYICSPLGLVPKSDGNFRRIHHLSYPPRDSTNDHIAGAYGNLRYTSRSQLLQLVKTAGRGSVLIKRDLADAFRHIPIALQNRWLMGFHWKGVYYVETCLSFGLRTAPYLFNLFAEALHWLLSWFLPTALLAHYLDDFIDVVRATDAHGAAQFRSGWDTLTSFLGFKRNAAKDGEGTSLECLGIQIDTLAMKATLPPKKREKAILLVHNMLTNDQVTL